MTYSIGITGSTGSLGKVILKKFKRFKIKKFQGDIRNRKEVFNWISRNKLRVIIHLAAVVPIKIVNQNEKSSKSKFYGNQKYCRCIIKNNVNWFFFHPHHMCTDHLVNQYRKIFKKTYIILWTN